MSDILEAVKAIEALADYRNTHKLEFYTPYNFQKAFHNAYSGMICPSPTDKDLDKISESLEKEGISVQRCLMCGNQIGKTTCAAMEIAFHATGLYPDWWEGTRFDHPVECVAAGHRNESTRDVIQAELLGDPFEESALGTGAIPKELIGKTTRKAGVPNALTAVMVKHITGKWSKIRFMSYEQGPDAFMGIRFHVGWLDEEPPQDVWTQFIRAVLSRKSYTLMLTFTPENGVTEVVDSFSNHLKEGQSLVTATWDDAGHMTPEKQEAFLAQLPPHEREMRKKGIPMMGSGLIFPVPDDMISCERFPIPDHFRQISGIDFGVDHPFAWANIAYDADRDIIYVTDVYRESKALISTHSSTIRHRSQDWIPIVWPHDGLQTDPKSGATLADLYRDENLNLTDERFTNPPAPGQKEGQGGNGVEAGLMDMRERMETGRFKVFSDLSEFFEEKRQYHRKDGKVVKLRDDIMSATRYAAMSIRHAITRPTVRRRQHVMTGVSNW